MNDDKISGVEWARLNCDFVSFCVGRNDRNCRECNDKEDDTPKVDTGVTP